jgi:non-specific serine/threonine protein kinase/serine/threonine-protein kinase
MNAERWQQVREILDRAIALRGNERAAYLEAACLPDASLRSEVESLVRSHEAAGSVFLKNPALDLKSAAAQITSTPNRLGRKIGVYEIVEVIGRGGMGEVYRAVRADGQFNQQVAIKLVRVGLDTPTLLERFRHERQILASLDHPNIARLYDGGTSEDGIPYLVMELIEGQRVDTYCDAHTLSITQRLQLFRQICAAVQYAHQRLVIHRDLKPSNVLVTAEGVPKLLDFGIAKLLDPTVVAETTLERPMTPEYASPEQIRGEPITTASDVYSLGIVLYQLLAGRSPYGDTRGPHELARAVCEADPGKPSSVVLKPQPVRMGDEIQPATPEQISISREGSPAKLRRRLVGDLDNIVLKALRKEPHRRYASVEQFAEDIRRHLEGLPVTAVKGSVRYRAAKFVRRNRAAVAAAVVVAVTLIVGIGATVRQARIARRQAEIAQTERAKSEKRFNDVRELSDSLIFDVHDAIQNLPGATPARKLLLDRALQYLDHVASDSAGNPDLERELAWGYQRIAVVQGSPTESNLGDQQAAEASDRKALELFEAVARANPTNVIDQLNVAMMHRILSFSALMDPRGQKDLQEAMAISERLIKLDSSNPKVLSERSVEYQNLALMQDALGDRVHALESYRHNLALKQQILRTSPGYRQIRRSSGMASIMLGSALARSGQREEALKTIQQGIAFYDSVPNGDDDINVKRERAISRQKLGDILLMNGDTQAALVNYREAHDALQPLAKADPQNTMLQLDVAAMNYHMARVLIVLGKYNDAISRLRSASAVFSSLRADSRSADDSPRGLTAIEIWLGDAYARKDDLPAALQQYRKAINDVGPSSATGMDADARCELAMSYIKSAAGLARLGKLGEAENAYKKALDSVSVMAIPEHQDVPALYMQAEASAGLGSIILKLARNTVDANDRTRLQQQAGSLEKQARRAWAQIPNPSRIDPSGFLVNTLTPATEPSKSVLTSAAVPR